MLNSKNSGNTAGLPAGDFVFLTHAEVAEQIPNWQNNLPEDIKKSHVNRQRDWITSRIALQKAFLNVGEKVLPLHLQGNPSQQRADNPHLGGGHPEGFNEQRPSKNHQSLPLFPNWKFSLSHSKNGALVWLLPTTARVRVGVDLETVDRPLSAALEARFRTSHDQNISAIALWSLKEAVYKSLPSDLQKDLGFSWIQVAEKSFAIPKLSESGDAGPATSPVNGHWLQITQGENILSFAWI